MTMHMMIRYATVPFILALVLLAGNTQGATTGFNYSLFYPDDAMSPTSLPPLRAGGLALADFNGDAGIDAVVPGQCVAGVGIILNNAVATWISTGACPTAVAAADFNADGYMDVAVAEYTTSGISVLTNDGAGNFTRTAYATGAAIPAIGPVAIAAADIDKDGRLDLVVANRFSETVVVLHNTGPGFLLAQVVAVSNEPNALVVADLDNDGFPDVAVACAADDTVKILTNTAGILTLSDTLDAGPYPVAVAAADLDNDGYLDLAVADREAPQVTVLLGSVGRTWTVTDVPLLAAGHGAFEPPADVQLVDTNADGKIDISCAGVTLRNDGAAHFSTTATATVAGCVYARARLSSEPYLFLGQASQDVYHVSKLGVSYQFPPTLHTPAADITGDTRVNILDLLTLADSWGRGVDQAGFQPACDLNRDGSVDVLDLLILAGGWGI